MGSKKESPPPKAKGGCISKLATLVVVVGLVVVAGALYTISQPQDLSGIAGRGAAAVGKESRNLKAVLKNATEGGYPLKLSEEEINLYLRDTLNFKQDGALGEWVKLEGVMIRLEDERAEVIMERSIMGYPLTVSMYLRVEQMEKPDGGITTQIFRNGGPYQDWLPKPMVGGRFGQLPVPEGFLLMVMPAFQKLAYVYREPVQPGSMLRRKPVKEIDFIEDMVRIAIKEGQLVLDAAPNTRAMPSR